MTAVSPYRVLFCDLRTDRVLDSLPLRDVQVDDYIGRTGSLTGTLPIPDAATAARAQALQEGRTAVYLERGGDLWWGGILWTTTLTSDDKGAMSLTIQAATFDSYAARRRIRRDFVSVGEQDELAFARDLWTYMQDSEGGDIGVVVGEEMSGQMLEVSWRATDEIVVDDALREIADSENGFEQYIEVSRNPDTGVRTKRLRLGTPQLEQGGEDLVLDRPGSILGYSFPRDATRGGTHARVRGGTIERNASQEGRQIVSRVVADRELIAEGWPQIDLSADLPQVLWPWRLERHAVMLLRRARGTVVIPEITVRLDDRLPLPPRLLGRTVRLRITDEWHPDGFEGRFRVVGIKITPPQRGRPETAELFLERR
ncbi:MULTISPECIES: hypothetical protein [Streptomyces]|uniref:Minor tail protein n=1 Tax=Streptomyces tsukubensis (strain DSM 42081 / NBRC 108919 / NRRL 18488 / 9993) TaxID=1114943 RepID=I2N4B0_STRT9|nr:hypothetical protein [Streptomyces tsukubensis]MYS68533.1 hypothetical protein [Streptomyces sp. SID5473]AZK95926.1 hypothetical protein B7R87_20215 [Streptomyces tsukubensis]EIF91857.1 hypothetical protein [Streptomyces tsukubensis NRRL18488]QKM68055.1 hypothetical protein STSU_013570 [Streptomyces tsukubensis NRRL18488]TAI44455.1 hypothetical protein EWI31_13365 [Streptomyces tsukubensis]